MITTTMAAVLLGALLIVIYALVREMQNLRTAIKHHKRIIEDMFNKIDEILNIKK